MTKSGAAERAREEAARGPDPAGALPALDRFLAAAGPRAKSLLSRDGAPRALATLLSLGEAPARAVERDPAALAFAMDGPGRPPAAEVEARIRAAAGDGAALRRARRRELLRILLADATGAADLDATAGAISDLADAVLRAVLDRELAAAAARDGAPRHADGSPAAIACVALGKLGGGELNYSSDVDLLFVRSGEGRCAGGRDLLEHYGAAVGSTVRALSRPTEDGHLYRVDLRLRPRGAAGALVPRAAGAVHYYRSLGRGWERQALLKARPVAGDLDLGASFLRDLEPWVYGRPLLMAEISEIRRLKRDLEGGADAGEGNLKTGRGGIRDIEWVVQFLQLLLGAEHPSVRASGTKEGLRRLRAAEALDDGEARALAAAYDFLRTAEHRLQAADDTQVHALPADEAGVALLARRLGFGSDGRDAAAEFRAEHARHAAAARGALDRLVHDAFSAEEEKARRVVDLLLGGSEVGADEAAAALRPFGFRDPAAAFADLRRMERARSPWLPRTRAYFASAAPALLGRAAATPDPDRALSLLQRLSERAAGSGLFFRLLTENPSVLGVFCDLAGHSPWLADLLWGRPQVMDAFLDSLVAASPEGRPPSEDLPLESIASAPDPAAVLEDVRDLETLRTATRDVQGRAHARRTARGLSETAERVVRLAVDAAAARLAAKGAPQAPGRFAVLALGRLGSREMAYRSDLDLVFLHDGGDGAEPAERLARESVALLGGAAGRRAVYEVDLRLRPDGRRGTAAASVAAFAKYLKGRAETWERQALVRARPVAGDAALGREAMAAIEKALFAKPAASGLEREVRAMRARLEEAAGPHCLKAGRGGLQDAEFLAQALVLRHGPRDASVRGPGTVEALTALRDAELLAPADHEGVVTAYLFLRAVELRLRLSGEGVGSTYPADHAARDALARRLGYVDTAVAPAGKSLTEEVAWYRDSLRGIFDRLLGRAAGPPAL